MAININATLTTEEGFSVDSAWGFVNQYFTGDNWANISYYRSKASYQNGDAPINVASLPSRVSTEITNTEFWSDSLMTTVHNRCISKIEEVTGDDTCTIDNTDL